METIEHLLCFTLRGSPPALHYNCRHARIPHNSYLLANFLAIVVEGKPNSNYHMAFSWLCNATSHYGQNGYTEWQRTSFPASADILIGVETFLFATGGKIRSRSAFLSYNFFVFLHKVITRTHAQSHVLPQNTEECAETTRGHVM